MNQIADLMEGMGLDNVQRLVAMARVNRQQNANTAADDNTAPPLPASSIQPATTTIASRPMQSTDTDTTAPAEIPRPQYEPGSVPIEGITRPQYDDDAPLSGLLSHPPQRTHETESTSMAAILQNAAPLPAPQPEQQRVGTWMGVEVPQPPAAAIAPAPTLP
eukprot:6491456-Amphidinium_carterae.1